MIKNPAIGIQKLVDEAQAIQSGDQVSKYLQSRGLYEIPQDLKIHPELFNFESKKYFPAMLAMVRDVNGEIVSVHKTFLQNGKKASLTNPRRVERTIGAINGAAIRLYPAAFHIGIAEGVETAMAAHIMFNMPVWSAVRAQGLKKFDLPSGVEEITIFGDKDKNFAGQKAGYSLANKLAARGVKVHIRFPEITGEDWNDVLMRERGVSQ